MDIINNILGYIKIDKNYKIIYTNQLIKEHFNILETTIHQGLIYETTSEFIDVEIEKNKNFITKHIIQESEIILITKNKENLWFKIKRIIDDHMYIFIFYDINDVKTNIINEKKNIDFIYRHKTLFLSNMIHQITTPLNAIVGLLSLLEYSNLTRDQFDNVQVLRECSINIMTIVNDILDFIKFDSNKIVLNTKCVDFREMIEDCNNIIQSKIKYANKNIQYKCNIENEVPECFYIDEFRLRQVILNIITNIFQISNEEYNSARLELHIKLLNKLNDNLEIEYNLLDVYYNLFNDDIKKIFLIDEYNDMLKLSEYNSNILGIIIAKHIIKLMNGSIYCTLKENGYRIIFTIKTTKCVSVIDPEILKAKLIKKKIFIFTNKPAYKVFFTNYFYNFNIEVQFFSCVNDGMYFIKEYKYKYDIFIIDMTNYIGDAFLKEFNIYKNSVLYYTKVQIIYILLQNSEIEKKFNKSQILYDLPNDKKFSKLLNNILK